MMMIDIHMSGFDKIYIRIQTQNIIESKLDAYKFWILKFNLIRYYTYELIDTVKFKEAKDYDNLYGSVTNILFEWLNRFFYKLILRHD